MSPMASWHSVRTHAIVWSVMLCSVLAQASGTYTTGVAGKDDAGKKHIETKTKPSDVKITEIRIWEPMSETWIKIKPTSIVPNPGKDPKIELPDPVREGDKFQIDWETTSNDNPAITGSSYS